MSCPGRAALACAALAIFAPVADARVPADAAARKQAQRVLVRSLSAPSSVRAGTRFRVRVRISGRRAGTARLTLTLRRSGSARRLRTVKVKLTSRRRSRRVTLRLRMPSSLPAGRYTLRACVRTSCRSRRITVTRPGTGPGGGGGGGGGGTPELGAQQSLRAPLTGENFYFVMADRFRNGDDTNDRGGLSGTRLQHGFDPTHKGFYHGGDLKGMLEQIDYIKGLGTTAIWLTPSFKNKPVQGPSGQETAGYHGYWITDFTQIDPHLGSNADLAALVRAAHVRGMKVFFDIITNHTADVISYDQKPGGPAPYGYVPKDDVAYRTSAGSPFDDRDYAGTGSFPPLDASTSFPFVPVQGSDHKVPEWLNDVTLYHNRGDTTFIGENSLYGDFFGLDDLFTEHPRVVDGMVDIYKQWITDFKIDGFRIDTMKHVNDEFWKRFAPEVLDHAHAQGKDKFLMFGEVFDTTKTFTSHFTTRDRVQAVLDFPFQAAAQNFAANSGPTDRLREFFVADDWYTDADSNVYQLPTFLGNHDMGRIGRFITIANGGASDEEIFRRDRLAHQLMYFSRGNPVIYYGDEQGFVGDGGDQDARQDMCESDVATYNDDDLIATDNTTADCNFETSHRLYEAIAELARVTREHPALRNSAHQHRYSTDGAGVYGFSRLHRGSQREYVVALNNAEQPREALIPTAAAPGAAFGVVYGTGAASVTDAGGRLPVVVPPLSAVVYRSDAAIPKSAAAPHLSLAAQPDGGAPRDRVQVRAFADGDSFYDVTFHAKVADGPWTAIGTDDNAPYRVFHDVADLAPGTAVQYRAVVLDNAGNTRQSEVYDIRVAEPAVTLTAPAEDGNVRDRARLVAEVVPDDNDNAVTFQRSVDGGAWTTVATDDSQPVYSATDDVSGLAPGTPLRYRAILTYAAGRTVTSASRSATVATPVTTAVIHYNRPAGDYAEWGLHLWGDGLAPGEATAAWDAPTPFEGTDSYGAFHAIELVDDTDQIGFIVHGMPPNHDTKDTPNDRFFTPVDHPAIWLKQGDPTIYFSPPPP